MLCLYLGLYNDHDLWVFYNLYFQRVFLRIIFCKYTILLHLHVILILFSFSKSIIRLACFFKDPQNFFIQFFRWKYVYLLYDILNFLYDIILHGIFSDFIYCLNSYFLSFPQGITIPQKSLFLHAFSWDLSLLSVLKE